MTSNPGLLSLWQAGSGVAASHTGHGAVPQGWLGSLVLGLAMAIVLLVFALCAKYFVRPGETSPEHIKRRILD